MKNKKAFSLIELMATIIILGLVALTTVYTAKKQIDKSKKNGFKEDLRSIIRATEIYKETNDLYSFTIELDELDIKNMSDFTGTISYGESIVTLINITNQEFCGNGTSDNLVIVKGAC